MKGSELRELSSAELNGKVAALKDELFKLRFQSATNNLDNPARIREVRRDIARVKTVIRERELRANTKA